MGGQPQFEVAIVGYGPVGATLAVLLAQAGRSVVVLERWNDRYPLPRAVHMDDEVARIFQACGLGEELTSLTEPADLYEWRSAEGLTLLRLGRDGVGACGWPNSLMFNQPAMEAALDERVRSLGVEIRRGEEVTDLARGDTDVALSTAAGTTVTASYVVGCDGANSTVRRLVGFDFVDLGFFYDWLVVDAVLSEPRVFDPPNLQVCDPARPTTLVSGGPGRRRWEFMRLPHEALEDLNSIDRAWELLEPWDVNRSNAVLERHAVYTFNARFAEQWRAGRVLIAGDAAHQMPPFAGQGMCSGIRDVSNLAWKLALVLSGCASDSLLDTYEIERRLEVRSTIEFSMELGKVICVPDPDEATARDQAMSSAVGPEPTEVPALPPISDGVIDSGTASAGHLFPQGRLAGRLFDDVHGAGFRLVAVEPVGPLDAELVGWFESVGGRIVTVPADAAPYAGWFAGNGCRVALQRPDFHVYGTADTPAGTDALLSGLRSRLGGGGANAHRSPETDRPGGTTGPVTAPRL